MDGDDTTSGRCELARFHQTSRDDTVDRRPHFGVAARRVGLELSCVGGVRRCAGGLVVGFGFVQGRAADEVLVEQTAGALEVQAGLLQFGVGLGEAGTPRRNLGIGLPRVNARQYLSSLHPIAGVDQELDDDTGQLRGYGGLAYGFDDRIGRIDLVDRLDARLKYGLHSSRASFHAVVGADADRGRQRQQCGGCGANGRCAGFIDVTGVGRRCWRPHVYAGQVRSRPVASATTPI
jgi:hypothetical protein